MLWYCPEYDKTSTLSLFFIRMLVFRPKLILGWKCSCIILKLHFMTFSFYPEKTADIWRRYHWSPRQMTSEKRALKFHTDDASLPRSGYIASDWSCHVGSLFQPMRSTIQIWVVTRHQYGISTHVSQRSFSGATNGSVAKSWLFSQALFVLECIWVSHYS